VPPTAEETGPGRWCDPKDVGRRPQTDDFRVVPAWRKGHNRQGQGKDDVVRGTPKERTFEKRRQARPKRNNGIRDLGVRRELHLGSKETFYETLGQTHELDVVKRAIEISIGMRKVCD
jgi:hypothetical protein